MNKTIVYISSNREDPQFEMRVMEDLMLKAGDLPIISVTQKPCPLGKNICVGDVGLSYINEWKQILLGVQEAKTPYIQIAESDFIYPPEHFAFVPTGADAYRNDNVWIIWTKWNRARRKSSSEGAMIVKKDWYQPFLEEFLKDYPTWVEGIFKLPSVVPFEFFHSEAPAISFKTGDGVRLNTNVLNGDENRALEFPYWGTVAEIKERFLWS